MISLLFSHQIFTSKEKTGLQNFLNNIRGEGILVGSRSTLEFPSRVNHPDPSLYCIARTWVNSRHSRLTRLNLLFLKGSEVHVLACFLNKEGLKSFPVIFRKIKNKRTNSKRANPHWTKKKPIKL